MLFGIMASGQSVASPAAIGVDCNNLDCSQSLSLSNDTHEGTFSAWIKTPTDSVYKDLFTIGNSAGTGYQVLVRKSNVGRINLHFKNAAGTNRGAGYTSHLIWDNNWHHFYVTWRWSGTGAPILTIYIDGEVDTITWTTTAVAATMDYGSFDMMTRDYAITKTPWKDEIAQLWFKDEYIDPAASSNLDYFYDAGPVQMGSDGQTGSFIPQVYFNGDADNWISGNKGTGGAFGASSNDVIDALTNPA